MMSKFQHDVMLRAVKFLDVILMTLPKTRMGAALSFLLLILGKTSGYRAIFGV